MHKDNGEWLVVLQGDGGGNEGRRCNFATEGWFFGGGEILLGVLRGAGEKTGDGKIDKAAGESLLELAREGGRARRAGRRRRP